MSKHVAFIDTQVQLSKYNHVLTEHIYFLFYCNTIVIYCGAIYKDLQNIVALPHTHTHTHTHTHIYIYVKLRSAQVGLETVSSGDANHENIFYRGKFVSSYL